MYTYVTSFEQFGEFVSQIQKVDVVGFDVETTGLDPFTSTLLLIQAKLQTTFIFDARKLGKKLCVYAAQLLQDSGKTLIGHNIKFDVKVISSCLGELLTNVYDTMIAETLITNGLAKGEERYFSLNDLTEKYCGVTLDKSVRQSFYKQEDPVITEQELIYSAEDVEYLETIRTKQLATLTEQKQLRVVELEMQLIPVLASMELEGVGIDQDMWKRLGGESLAEAKRLEKELIDEMFEPILKMKWATALELVDFLHITDNWKTKKAREMAASITDISTVADAIKSAFNLGSSKQLLVVLRDVYKIPIADTNEKTINKFEIEYPIINKLLKYREFAKSVSTYGEKFLLEIHPVTGRIHTEFNQMGMVSGRISSSKPNLQNIKKESAYRNAFVARPGKKIISIDFSQEELRLMAVIAKVKGMIEAFKNGVDLHLATASGLFKIALDQVTKAQRQKGKTLNFAVGYGSTEFGLWKNFGIPMEEGREYLRIFYKEVYPEIEMCKEAAGKRILELGYSTTLLGRKRFFEIPKFYPGGMKEKLKVEAAIVREGFNHIIQGTGAEVLKKSLIRLFYENPFGRERMKPLLQVYDELVIEADEEIANEAFAFVERVMLECEGEYLRGVVPAAVDGKVDNCWVH